MLRKKRSELFHPPFANETHITTIAIVKMGIVSYVVLVNNAIEHATILKSALPIDSSGEFNTSIPFTDIFSWVRGCYSLLRSCCYAVAKRVTQKAVKQPSEAHICLPSLLR
jgi:hypothetical protein